MALMKDKDGQLWDVDLNGKAHTPHFGDEVTDGLISGLPVAMKLNQDRWMAQTRKR